VEHQMLCFIEERLIWNLDEKKVEYDSSLFI
jgi:hypothetical protein